MNLCSTFISWENLSAREQIEERIRQLRWKRDHGALHRPSPLELRHIFSVAAIIAGQGKLQQQIS